MQPVGYGNEFFDEARKFFSETMFSLFLCPTNEKERFAEKTTREIESWRQRWMQSEEGRKFMPLITAVDMMLNREIFGQ
jgi:hypothetical protein